jgi:hypothetical protein
MKKSATTKGESPSRLIDARIKDLDDWRGKTLSHVRALIKQADPEVVEEWKWRGVPVWSHDGPDLHRRDVQERREADFLQERFAQPSFRAVQRQP